MAKQKRKLCLIHIRCDEEDRALFDYKAKAAGMSRSELMRNFLYHGSVERHTNYSKEDARALLNELCNISNAMAQISYSARLKSSVDEGEFLQLESNFKALVEAYSDHIVG